MRALITGAAGHIGSEMVSEFAQTHEIRLIDRVPVSGHESIVADLTEARVRNPLKPWSKSRLPPWVRAFEGVDVVLHFAAERSPRAAWEKVLSDNFRGTWNIIEAAANYHVPRVVFASSNWAVKAIERRLAPECYAPEGRKISYDAYPSPITPYGLSKAFGEIAGRMFVDEGRLRSFIAVRIGNYSPTPPKDEILRTRWIGVDDIKSLFRRCVEAHVEGFHIVYGVSAQNTAPYDLSHTRELLSWEPRQNALV
jgi:uronate dehydrogenase